MKCTLSIYCKITWKETTQLDVYICYQTIIIQLNDPTNDSSLYSTPTNLFLSIGSIIGPPATTYGLFEFVLKLSLKIQREYQHTATESVNVNPAG